MKTQKIGALVVVELKKLYRDPMTLAVIAAHAGRADPDLLPGSEQVSDPMTTIPSRG